MFSGDAKFTNQTTDSFVGPYALAAMALVSGVFLMSFSLDGMVIAFANGWATNAAWGAMLLVAEADRYSAEDFAIGPLTAPVKSVEERRYDLLCRDAALGGQTRILVHEMNNLITIVDLASQRQEHIDFPRLRRSLSLIKRINKLVLKDLALEPEIVQSKLEEVLADVHLLLRRNLHGAGVQLVLDVPQDLADVVVRERAGSLFLVLRNLIANGRDAVTPTQQPPSSALIRVTAQWHEGQAQIIVEDNGCGMTPGALKSLMQGEAQTTKSEGHGLGFQFVLEECSRNGFTLTAESRLGRGTRMTLTLPVVNTGRGLHQAA